MIKSIEELREFFLADKFAMGIGIDIESVDENGAVCTLLTNEGHLNAGGVVQGGVIYTLADFAFAVAANADGVMTPTINASMSYIKGAKGTPRLIAKADLVHKGASTCVYNVSVTDESGALIAAATITGLRKIR